MVYTIRVVYYLDDSVCCLFAAILNYYIRCSRCVWKNVASSVPMILSTNRRTNFLKLPILDQASVMTGCCCLHLQFAALDYYGSIGFLLGVDRAKAKGGGGV